MKKKEAKAIGALVVIGIIVYPFVWLADNLGAVGFSVITVVGVCGLVGWRIHAKKAEQDAFDRLCRLTAFGESTPEQDQSVQRIARRGSFGRAQLLRELQIARDCVRICRTSKIRDTAESRAGLLLEKVACVQRARNLMSAETYSRILGHFQDALEQYPSQLSLNIALGHYERVSTLKTGKSKVKYLQLALEEVDEGLSKPGDSTQKLSALRKRVEEQLANFS